MLRGDDGRFLGEVLQVGDVGPPYCAQILQICACGCILCCLRLLASLAESRAMPYYLSTHCVTVKASGWARSVSSPLPVAVSMSASPFQHCSTSRCNGSQINFLGGM